MTRSQPHLVAAYGLMLAICAGGPVSADDLTSLEQQAIQEAVARVAPSVVRIETVGGLDRVGRVLIGDGPTTGLVVSAEGDIISSAFNFASLPSSILVTLDDGTRLPARIVANDHSRMLTLLRIDAPRPLTVPEAAPRDETRVGQWAIALGRTFDVDAPNVSVGIVSALDRIWGKALQTDANVSPSNYGGPLVDIHGRVLGMIVPLAPNASSEVAGVEWYDSGIGFAVPLTDVQEVLPRLAQGEELFPGLLGVAMRRGSPFADPPIVASVRAGSPAGRAGLKADDRILAVDDVAVDAESQFEGQIERRYAGETIQLRWQRGDEELQATAELVAELVPYDYPFLGVLPRRNEADAAGVGVRWVYPESAAATAGIGPDDRITSVNGEPVADRDALIEQITAQEVGQKVRISILRGDEELEVEAELESLPESVPPPLPPARDDEAEPPAERPAVGTIKMQLPEFPNEAQVFVPPSYDPAVLHGVVLWLQAPGDDDEEILTRWDDICATHDLILVAPRPADPEKWLPADVEFITKLLDKVMDTYEVDPARVVAHGLRAGGTLAFLIAAADRDAVRAVASVDGPAPRMRPLENEPLRPLAVFLATRDPQEAGEADEDDSPAEATVQTLRAAKIPVTTTSLGSEPRYLDDDELAELARWIDALDRI